MKDIIVSVIIPVYSVEEFLENCVESVLTQSYSGIEIILVDDGSPDNSAEICDKYASLYSNIKVVHKENGGLSDARNAGVSVATGDYVLFLDGDDYWDDNDAVLKLVSRIKQSRADVLNFSYKKVYTDVNEIEPYFYGLPAMPLDLKDKKRQLDFLAEHGMYIASACNKLIKRSLLDESLRFELGIYSEDIEWCAKLLVKAESMDFICENFYCYRQRRGSITHTINLKKCTDLCNNILKCLNILDSASETDKNALSFYTAYQYGTFFKVQALTDEVPFDCISTLSKYKHILSFNKNKKLFLLNIACKLFGFKSVCRLIRFFYKARR